MKINLKYLLVLAAVVVGQGTARADEGMWMIHAIDSALEKRMQERGLELSAGEIYNADAPGASLADAVVSMEFGCTGSIISDNGLLITNHHCAYGDIHRLSTPEHNYLEEGFWAMRSDEEVNIKGKKVYFLKRVLDVTAEVEELKKKGGADGKPLGMRRLSHLIERAYFEETGLEAFLGSMWDGSKYYMALYEVYGDVRLVAAPPVSSAAFGGDVDNWEWPQHKCDFAMYRVYTAPDGSPASYSAENVPMKPAAKLSVSLEGYKAGDFTMVIGFPGSTNRYSSSFETNFYETLRHPIANAVRGRQMEIIKGWMDSDPEVRLKYADYYFGLSNVQELYSGEVECLGRFGVVRKKEMIEKELQEWIEASPERVERWGRLLEDLKTKYLAVEDGERNVNYFRETLVRGTRIVRLCHRRRPEALLREFESIDLRVERELFGFAVAEFYENVDTSLMGDYHKRLLAEHSDYKALAEAVWAESVFTDEAAFRKLVSEGKTAEDYPSDPLYMFLQGMKITGFNQRIAAVEGEPGRRDLNREFTHALYQMRLEKGIPQYPDANSTMRVTFGTVGGYSPRDGVSLDWKTTPVGIMEKYDPSDYDFNLDERQLELYQVGDWGRWGVGCSGGGVGDDGTDGLNIYVNFLTDNDITGGNSGSPVLNARGELIGLAFDGNKESLSSDLWCEAEYNKCVCVDIRWILWTLDKYAGMGRIIEEIGL